MEATVSTAITINASITTVFEYLSDLHYHYLWNPQIRKISPMKRLTLGMQYKTESQVLGTLIESTNTVTSFIPPREMTLENSLGTVHYKAVFHLKSHDSKTYIKLIISLSADSKIWAFSAPILKQLALRELRSDLQALKVAAENKLK